jgi:hypothetical protein
MEWLLFVPVAFPIAFFIYRVAQPLGLTGWKYAAIAAVVVTAAQSGMSRLVRHHLVHSVSRSRLPFDAKFLLHFFLNAHDCDAFMGDLEERYGVIRAERGRAWAVFWFWREVLTSLGPLVLASVQNRLSRSLFTGPTFTVRAIGHLREGFEDGNGQAYQYVVENLPPGQEAWIANFGSPYRDHWRILRVQDGIQSDWKGEYGSADEALVALKKEIANRTQ